MKKIKFALLRCILSLVIVYSPFSFAQGGNGNLTADDFRIMHHESLTNFNFGQPDTVQRPSAAAQASATTLLTLEAYGQKFDIELESNDQLIDNLPKAQKSRVKQSMQIYKGRIPGIVGSWARINRHGGRISGAFWDGNELYLIDSSDEVGAAIDKGLTARASAQPYTLIYKLSETETTATCGVDPAAKPFNDYRGLVDELKAQATALPLATRKLDVAIVADAQFTQANSANPQAAVIARMNVVDGIYSDQVGVHLNISEIRALTNNGVLSSTNSGSLLDQLVRFTAPPGFNNPGLTHLFTGRNLDGSTIGVAYIGVLCRKDLGVGLSETGGTGTAGALTVAHEMGHNFGAPHDNQGGSACASTPGTFIMNPFLNGSTQFSTCSLQQISAQVNRAACITPITTNPSADVRPVIPVNPINVNVASTFNYSVEVRNGGTGAAQNSTAKISIPTGLTFSTVTATLGQCTQAAGTVNCTLGNLAPNAASTITLSLRSGTAPANLVSNVQVGASNDSNTGNNSVNVTINVRNNNATTLFQTDFNADVGGFGYVDDAFRATKQPAYASGSRVVTAANGQLRVLLGGRDNLAINGMSGGWRRSFNLAAPKAVTLSLDYRLDQAANYEADEFSDALLALDGRLVGVNGGTFLVRITGDGNGGAARSSGLRHADINLGTLPAGNHTVTVGGYNNKKTFSDESTAVLIDNIKAVTRP